jgi:superfamily I DNA and/or RNA helicase/transcription elongation GreA/GreB family factor/very-short-patch-repair endonuclease
LRKNDLQNQLSSINNSIQKVFEKEKGFEQLIAKTKNEYCSFRQLELWQQTEGVNKIISDIDSIFASNKDNNDLTNETRVNSFWFKITSYFSKLKKQTISDRAQLHNSFKKLQANVENAKDIQFKEFVGDIESKRNSLISFKSVISKVKKDFGQLIEEEFESFCLGSLLSSAEIKKVFKAIDSEIDNSEKSKEFTDTLQGIKGNFETYLNDLSAIFREISYGINESKDVELQSSFAGSFNDKKDILFLIIKGLEEIKTSFSSKIQTEFQTLLLLKLNPKDISIRSLPTLQEKVKALYDKIEFDSWDKEKIEATEFYRFITEVDAFIRRKGEYFNSEKDLFTIEFKWFQFYNALSENYKLVVRELKGKSNWRKSLLIYYLNSLLINAANLDLPSNDHEHIELDKALNGIEKEQLKFIKEFWFSKQIDATRQFEQKNSNLSVENLYNKRSSPRFKRLSLRQIVQYDADLFSTFFPIILTSPDVASNLFKGMNGYFDIVMFDEASQLRLEDNLPAILKGKQIVIAGDEHQMPPSNYFSKVFDGMVEDEEDLEEETEFVIDRDDILMSCESLLDFGSELNFQKKHLDFHYRSRHPFLIDFSNYAFYNQRLKPLPNNFEYLPIKYVQVNGTFSEHTNEAEADMVLSIIEKNINRLPNGEYPTVGVATFNIMQRNLIKSKILERQKFSKYNEFNAKIQELEENGMFIKNLENIQGDERDVIILSTTYGIGKDGKFAQRFGPINHSKGYKLLNVIITRAKFKVYVCSSIPEQVFMNYKEYLTTEGSNNKRAVFYAYLAYSKAVSEANNDLRLSVLTTLSENTSKSAGFDAFKGQDLESPFEEEVYQSLADHFGTDKLIPQMQFGGFRIDIVYNSQVSGVPKIAIECDGAKYHSSREAYLYDTHRQKILESHDFVFHRIWSTNWWRNAGRETTKLVDFIKNVESTRKSKSEDYSNTSFAFNDDIVIIENYVSRDLFNAPDRDISVLETIEKKTVEQPIDLKDKVKLDSKVQVKYLNNNKDLYVQLVLTENNKNDASSTTQKIYYKSSLAVALFGRTVGEIVKVGNLDNFVEIISIAN